MKLTYMYGLHIHKSSLGLRSIQRFCKPTYMHMCGFLSFTHTSIDMRKRSTKYKYELSSLSIYPFRNACTHSLTTANEREEWRNKKKKKKRRKKNIYVSENGLGSRTCCTGAYNLIIITIATHCIVPSCCCLLRLLISYSIVYSILFLLVSLIWK